MKYIDAEKLISEIKGKIAEIEKEPAPADRETILLQMCKINAFREVLGVITRLEKTSLQQEQPPRGYDEAYLNECIAKASKTWKGVDVDKFIDEVRGRETMVLEEEVKKYFQGLWPGTETADQCNTDMHFTPLAILRMVEYFYELGLKAKEESK